MKAPFSQYLNETAPGIRELISILSGGFDYVSVLATDSKGFSIHISKHSRSISGETMTTERGIVVRAAKGSRWCEYSLNEFDPADVKKTAEEILETWRLQQELLDEADVQPYPTDSLADEPAEVYYEAETGKLPEETDLQGITEKLTALCEDTVNQREHIVDCFISADSTHISKLFMTAQKDMRQSYVYSEASVFAVASRDDNNQSVYDGISGKCGPELFDELEPCVKKVADWAEELLDAERMIPGEYEVIAAPDISGLIAHEAFGHGVEMDMFVKDRALGKEYIGKRVGSDLVTMHEGALCAENVTSYCFDDEGTPAGDVVEIRNGILETGICDQLSALRLHTVPTGNGKRENFEHKVYTRMTNTVFEGGHDKLEDMIASIKYGFLLEGVESGMEDPKHWGIQCIVKSGREIRDGKLTGKIFAPVIMTGYVPDLLGGISMATEEVEVFGCGGCGKGYKEWVKVADGGPYLKTKARLG